LALVSELLDIVIVIAVAAVVIVAFCIYLYLWALGRSREGHEDGQKIGDLEGRDKRYDLP
jgi:heme/copper-type cytochrome/quinol oxidase subunit 2